MVAGEGTTPPLCRGAATAAAPVGLGLLLSAGTERAATDCRPFAVASQVDVYLVDADANVPAPPPKADSPAPAGTAGPLDDTHLGLVWQLHAALREEPLRILLRGLRILFELLEGLFEPRAIHGPSHCPVKLVDRFLALLAILWTTWTSHLSSSSSGHACQMPRDHRFDSYAAARLVARSLSPPFLRSLSIVITGRGGIEAL